jgi:septal ring factor EnvC (AmiA/AmiB activator)
MPYLGNQPRKDTLREEIRSLKRQLSEEQRRAHRAEMHLHLAEKRLAALEAVLRRVQPATENISAEIADVLGRLARSKSTSK